MRNKPGSGFARHLGARAEVAGYGAVVKAVGRVAECLGMVAASVVKGCRRGVFWVN